MESSPSTANSGLVFMNFNQDFGCFVAVTSEGFRIFNADPLRQNKTECKSFSALAETVKNDGENSSVYLGPTITDVVDGKIGPPWLSDLQFFRMDHENRRVELHASKGVVGGDED